MQILDMVGCCTARVVCGFGNSSTAMHNREGRPKDGDIYKELKKQVPFLKRSGVAILFATTTSEQTQAEAELKAFGFIPTNMADKSKHEGLLLTGWHYIVGVDKGANLTPAGDVEKLSKEPPPAPEREVLAGELSEDDLVMGHEYLAQELHWSEEEKNRLGGYPTYVSRIFGYTGVYRGSLRSTESGTLYGLFKFNTYSGQFWVPLHCMRKVE